MSDNDTKGKKSTSKSLWLIYPMLAILWIQILTIKYSSDSGAWLGQVHWWSSHATLLLLFVLYGTYWLNLFSHIRQWKAARKYSNHNESAEASSDTAKSSSQPVVQLVLLLVFLTVILLPLTQSKVILLFKDSGSRHYEAGRYQEALTAYQRAEDAWYCNLLPNYFTSSSMDSIADCYCKLEDYDKAIATYNQIIDEHPGTYDADFALFERDQLIDGLEVIEKLGELSIPETTEAAFDWFDLAYAYKNINHEEKALAIFQKILTFDIEEDWKENARIWVKLYTDEITAEEASKLFSKRLEANES